MSNSFCDLDHKQDRAPLQQELQTISPSLDGLRILVVDDNDDCLYLVRVICEQCQAQVKTAQSVDEALEAVKKWKPDVLISDISMPDKDGYSLIGSIRIQEALNGGFLPAIALTSYVYPEDSLKALRAGFQEFIRKPFDPDELLAGVLKVNGSKWGVGK